MRAVQEKRRRSSVDLGGTSGGTTVSWAQRVRTSRELQAAGETSMPPVGGMVRHGLPPVRSGPRSPCIHAGLCGCCLRWTVPLFTDACRVNPQELTTRVIVRVVKEEHTAVHVLSAFLRAKDPNDKRVRSEFSQ